DTLTIVGTEGTIVQLEKKKKAATPVEARDLDLEIAKHRTKIQELREKINQVLAQDDVKPYIEALEKANQELTGRGQETPELDVPKINLKSQFEEISKSFDMIKPGLIKAMQDVDEAEDETARKRLAVIAAGQLGAFKGQVEELAGRAS